MAVKYHFSSFVFDPEHLTLSYAGHRVELGLKGVYILKALVENQNQLVAKDKLIEAAWSNQIVTDAALNKQIERLRQAMAAHEPEQTIIETERGLGYRLVSEVKASRLHRKNFNRWRWLFAGVFLVPVLLLVFFYQSDQPAKAPPLGLPFNLAVIPAAYGNEDRVHGGLVYLSQLLDKNPRVLSLRTEPDWFEAEKSEIGDDLAITLMDQKQLDYVLKVDLQSEQSRHRAQVELRNNDSINIHTELTADSLQQLLANINHWTQNQLASLNQNEMITAGSIETHLPDDDYAVESFLRGKKAANVRDYTQAVQFYQTAITQQPDFTLAQISLAEVQVLLGQYQEADALLTTIASTRDLTPDLSLMLKSNQANILVYTEQPKKAQPVIADALQQAEELHDSKSLEKLLYLQSVTGLNLNNLELAIASTERQKDVILASSKDPTRVIRVENNLAYFYLKSNQLDKAAQSILQVINAYEKMDGAAELLSSYSIYIEILMLQGHYEQAQLMVEKIRRVNVKGVNPRILLGAYNSVAVTQLAVGEHQQAYESIKDIENLSAVLKTEEPKILALAIHMELSVAKKQTESLASQLAQFKNYLEPSRTSQSFLYGEALPYIIKAHLELEQWEQATIHLREYQAFTANDEVLHHRSQILKARLLFEQQHLMAAEQLLVEAVDGLLSKQQLSDALQAAFVWLEIDQKQGFTKHPQILARFEPFDPFVYPLLKYQAAYQAHQNNYFVAAQLMQTMKAKAGEWWQAADQKLLEQYQARAKKAQ